MLNILTTLFFFSFRNFGFYTKRRHCYSHLINLHSRHFCNGIRSNDGKILKGGILRVVKLLSSSKNKKLCTHGKENGCDHNLNCLSHGSIQSIHSRNGCAYNTEIIPDGRLKIFVHTIITSN